MTLLSEELRGLSIADKLLLIEQLWEDITSAGEPLPVSEDVINEAKRRAAELSLGAETLTRAEVWQQVDSRRG